jgi:hypothetical protein
MRRIFRSGLAVPPRIWVTALFQIAVLGCSNDRPPIAGDCVSASTVPCTSPPAIGGTGGSSSCGLGSSLPACNSCIEQSCCQVDTTCAKNTSCVDLTQCLNACIPDGSTTLDPTCAQLCQSEQDAGINDYQNLASCVQSACAICQ